MHPGHASAKPVARGEVRRRRLARTPQDARAVSDGLAEQVQALLAALRARPTVAVYVSLPGEPGTTALRERLRSTGATVLLPWLQDDRDLDWVLDQDRGGTGPGLGRAAPTVAAATRPPGRRLGPDAVASVDAVLVPALAVDTGGTRLGQGGGSYDRSLARLPTVGRPLVLAVVHDDELLPAGALPVEQHDIAVDGALTPGGLRTFRRGAPAAHARPARPPHG